MAFRMDWTIHFHANRFGYTVTFQPVGEVGDAVGATTQMGVFSDAR